MNAITKIAGATAIGASIGSIGYYLGSRKKSKSTKSRRSKRKSKRKVSRSRIYKHKKGKRYTPRTAGKGRDKSMRRIRYTAKGQPYVIMANGRARFISMKSAKSSHKKKGGRY